MKSIEAKVFVGIRVLIVVFIIIFLIEFDNKRVTEALMPQILIGFVGLAFAILFAVNYDKGKNWARIWMFIANYLSIFVLIKDIADFSKISRYSKFETFANIGLLIDVICIIGTIFVIVKMHQKKPAQYGTTATGATHGTESPDVRLEQLNTMLQKGLITQEDFEKKKEDILKRM
jgi:hypothetical protein